MDLVTCREVDVVPMFDDSTLYDNIVLPEDHSIGKHVDMVMVPCIVVVMNNVLHDIAPLESRMWPPICIVLLIVLLR